MHFTSLSHLVARCLWTATLLSAAVLLLAEPAGAQQMTKEKVEITTDDGVTLVGDWYPSDKGKNGPVLVLLHAIGPGRKDAKRQDWEKFPEKLQKAGYHVLTFDFRGHGDSTKLADKQRYWKTMVDNRLPTPRLGTNLPATINSADWRNPQHLLWLGNDLIAVKKWLNLKNNAMECNSNNVCLIAAEQAGVLSYLFIHNEWTDPSHDKANDWSKPLALQFRNPSKWEGEDFSHLILLSMPNRLSTSNYQGLLKERMTNLRVKRAIDVLTVYGGDDQPVKTFWSEAIKWIKPEKEVKELEKTGRLEVPKTKLAGINLLTNEALEIEKKVLEYLDTHMSRGRPWQKQKEDERPILFSLEYATKSPSPIQ